MSTLKQVWLRFVAGIAASLSFGCAVAGWTNTTYVGGIFAAGGRAVAVSSTPDGLTFSGWGGATAGCPNPTIVQWLATNENSKTWMQMVLTARTLGLKVRFQITCEPSDAAYAWVSYVAIGEP